jgi:spermidine synthase
MARYCATILLGAFLLFQIQPQIARTILPWFGGGAAVWSTCMLFFQALLLGGYAYAHVLSRRLRPGKQAAVHVSLLAVSLWFLPVTPAQSWQPTGTENPSLHILLLLTATVGMPYLLLSATGPLMQAWFARAFEGRSPYRLYALSNVGSLAALLSFPFLFEPNLTIGIQAGAWSCAYLAFAVLCAMCAVGTARTCEPRAESGFLIPRPELSARAATSTTPAPAPVGARRPIADAPTSTVESGGGVATRRAVATTPAVERATLLVTEPERERCPDLDRAPGARRRLLWVALAALPSVMLLAVTNTICQDVAVIPFLWVMPLSIYLVTFILTFDSDRWYRRAILAPSLGVVAVAIFLIPSTVFVQSVGQQATLLCAVLFLCGMVCHGELVRDRPASSHLTGFYLCVAFGGAVGGLFVAVLAPLLFDTFFETEIALFGCVLAAAWAGFRVRAGADTRRTLRIVLPSAYALLLTAGIVERMVGGEEIVEERNFFGTLAVRSEPDVIVTATGIVTQRTLTLTRGSTIHGRQVFGDRVISGQAMTYYWPGSGVAHALLLHPARDERPLRVGIVGLGTGTLAHYARNEDRYTFFEIDPAIERVAERHFTYLEDARARGATVEVRLGDARIQLERAARSHGSMGFDVLVVDAFHSDAIPVHLLTKECNAVYWRHLSEDGILVVHVSNRHLDLRPVVRALAATAGKEARVIHARQPQVPGTNASDWIVVTSNAEYLGRAELQVAPSATKEPALLWTDDFSSPWHVLK